MLKKIFKSYGETELAEDDEALQEMVDAVVPKGTTRVLDIATFADALTYDVKLYDLGGEIRRTTHFEDVMLTSNGREILGGDDLDANLGLTLEDIEKRKSLAVALKKKFTAPAIDSVTGSYRSKYLSVFLWVSCEFFFGSSYKDTVGNI